jgi:hypothetical protein
MDWWIRRPPPLSQQIFVAILLDYILFLVLGTRFDIVNWQPSPSSRQTPRRIPVPVGAPGGLQTDIYLVLRVLWSGLVIDKTPEKACKTLRSSSKNIACHILLGDILATTKS